VRLEITATIIESWNDQPEVAAEALREWANTKASAQLAGGNVDEQLRQVIARHAHQASIHGQPNAEHADGWEGDDR